MGLRARVGWMVNGHSGTTRSLEALSTDLRALQEKVAAMQASVDRALQGTADEIGSLRAEQLDQFDSVRDAVITATDDLSERIAALQPHRAPAAS
jgi:hypothetical protein